MRELERAFTARAIVSRMDDYARSIGSAPFLGRSLFGTEKIDGLEIGFIKGAHGIPVALKAAAYDAQAPLRDAIPVTYIENEMPFFRESYMVTERERIRYEQLDAAMSGDARARNVLREIMKNPWDLILGAQVVPERMIWSLIAPTSGIPAIEVYGDGVGTPIEISYTTDNGADFRANHYMAAASAEASWSAAATATPIADMLEAKNKQGDNGYVLRRFCMNQNTWEMLLNAEDTKKRVLGLVAYQGGVAMDTPQVVTYLASLGIEVYVYNKKYIAEDGTTKTFIPDGVVTCLSEGVDVLGSVYFGSTPEERSGDLSIGNLAMYDRGIAVYTYSTPHPINTHCVVSETVLPSFENMDSIFVMSMLYSG